ncbi:MAG: hypothetical protein KAR19_08580 [Bacteroidales bacterium]|nr:hypothetical protein [Bacteroidales bacterium]
MKTQKTTLFLGLLCLISTVSFSQQQINLADEFQEKQIKAVNRTISLCANHPDAVEMNAVNGDGLGILEELEFEKGIIEVELLGENAPGRSFIGIAFNIQDEETYEVIYFRPFNFVADEQIRKEHMVQYIFHPDFTWRKLREERTGEFENEIPVPPDPDDWFRAYIQITGEQVKVYVNKISKPVLEIDRLTTTKSTVLIALSTTAPFKIFCGKEIINGIFEDTSSRRMIRYNFFIRLIFGFCKRVTMQ